MQLLVSTNRVITIFKRAEIRNALHIHTVKPLYQIFTERPTLASSPCLFCCRHTFYFIDPILHTFGVRLFPIKCSKVIYLKLFHLVVYDKNYPNK